jgi:hypothetical protein
MNNKKIGTGVAIILTLAAASVLPGCGGDRSNSSSSVNANASEPSPSASPAPVEKKLPLDSPAWKATGEYTAVAFRTKAGNVGQIVIGSAGAYIAFRWGAGQMVLFQHPANPEGGSWTEFRLKEGKAPELLFETADAAYVLSEPKPNEFHFTEKRKDSKTDAVAHEVTDSWGSLSTLMDYSFPDPGDTGLTKEMFLGSWCGRFPEQGGIEWIPAAITFTFKDVHTGTFVMEAGYTSSFTWDFEDGLLEVSEKERLMAPDGTRAEGISDSYQYIQVMRTGKLLQFTPNEAGLFPKGWCRKAGK